MTSLEQLKALLASGEFHHATVRQNGNLHDGLWFYRVSPASPRGFEVAGCVNARTDAADVDEAYRVVAHTGISAGSYGNG